MFGKEALLLGNQLNRVSYSVFRGLYNTAAVTNNRGVVTVTGADQMLAHNEFFGPSLGAVTSANLYIASVQVACAASSFIDCIFEVADSGLDLVAGGNYNRFAGCRFDTNSGHGMRILGGYLNTFAGCMWNRNSYSANGSVNNTYDHIYVPSSGGSGTNYFHGPTFANFPGNAVRWCVNDAYATVGFKNYYLHPTGQPGTTGFINVPYGGAVVVREYGQRTTRTVTTTATLIAGGDYLVLIDAGGAPTLPTAVSNGGRYTIKNIHTADRVVAATGAETIDGGSTITLTPGAAVDFMSDGTNWRIV